MGLRKFDQTNSVVHARGKAFIKLYSNGNIALSGHLARRLGLSENSRITLYQDDEKHMYWFICLNKDKYGFKLHKIPMGRSLSFNSIIIVNRIFKSFNLVTDGSSDISSVTFEVDLIPFNEGDNELYLISNTTMQIKLKKPATQNLLDRANADN